MYSFCSKTHFSTKMLSSHSLHYALSPTACAVDFYRCKSSELDKGFCELFFFLPIECGGEKLEMCSFRRRSEKDTEAAPLAADGSTALRIDEFHKLTLCRCWLLCPRAVLMTDEQPSLGPGWLFSKPGRPLRRERGRQ